jgi:hypothetical protein
VVLNGWTAVLIRDMEDPREWSGCGEAMAPW